MLTRRIIPCLDCRDGRVVKGVRFQELRDMGSPPELAARYEEEGADEIIVLDISATPEGRKTAVRTVAAIRARLGIPLTVGGGVRSIEDVRALLEAGADKVSVNTAAVMSPPLVSELADRFGSQCTVIAIDAAARGGEGGWEVVTHSGARRTGRDAIDWAREAVERGGGEILLTSWDRDGTREGFDLALVEAIASAVTVPVIASGGAAKPLDMAAALSAGADAVLAAGIFHEGLYTIRNVKEILQREGSEVRMC